MSASWSSRAALLAAVLLAAAVAAAAPPVNAPPLVTANERPSDEDVPLHQAALSLPLAAALGAALAFRPLRRGTPPRTPAVIHTQIVLAIIGAVVMLVVGASLARAFGIVGAAGLVRYRAKIEDPKDAGVMLSALVIGLASGVGMYLIAVASTAFILVVLWVLESLEPESRKVFTLKVAAREPAVLRPQVEGLLRRAHARFELRSSTPEDMTYEVRLPFDTRTDRLSNAILAMDDQGATSVQWEEKKKG
jgi:hypothetical protein